MGTMASRPASSASFADASVFCHVGMRISGTKLMLGIVFVQKVPSFSLLELKMGFVELLVTRVILPEISTITQWVERSGRRGEIANEFRRSVYSTQGCPGGPTAAAEGAARKAFDALRNSVTRRSGGRFLDGCRGVGAVPRCRRR